MEDTLKSSMRLFADILVAPAGSHHRSPPARHVQQSILQTINRWLADGRMTQRRWWNYCLIELPSEQSGNAIGMHQTKKAIGGAAREGTAGIDANWQPTA